MKKDYRCQDCYLKIDLRNTSFPTIGENGNHSFNEKDLICPVCNSLEKNPTPKMNQEDIEKKKVEIKERLNK